MNQIEAKRYTCALNPTISKIIEEQEERAMRYSTIEDLVNISELFLKQKVRRSKSLEDEHQAEELLEEEEIWNEVRGLKRILE